MAENIRKGPVIVYGECEHVHRGVAGGQVVRFPKRELLDANGTEFDTEERNPRWNLQWKNRSSQMHSERDNTAEGTECTYTK